SIYANNLTERGFGQGKQVFHGDIKEVSLVVAGANPGALIENINIMHGNVFETIDEEAIIHTGLDLDFTGEGEPPLVEETNPIQPEPAPEVAPEVAPESDPVVEPKPETEGDPVEDPE